MSDDAPLGTIAEFADADGMVAALRAARGAGWSRLEAYSPYPVAEASEALGVRGAPVAWIAIAAGIAGAALAHGMAWWVSTLDYPVNVGGRPPNAWPVFLPTTYLVGVLWACVAALAGMLWLNGLPRLHHPVFHARGFHRASEDRFFLMLEAGDPLYEAEAAGRFLRGFAPLRVTEVRES